MSHTALWTRVFPAQPVVACNTFVGELMVGSSMGRTSHSS